MITCSTKVCSFGKQVVEKVETEYARFENGRFVYRIRESPMCEYMINFIHKLKHLPEKYMMNSVLENFTILQVRRANVTDTIGNTRDNRGEQRTIMVRSEIMMTFYSISCLFFVSGCHG